MRRRLGQHFLRNPAVADAIAAAVDPSPGETVIEVGPGHGELTQALAARAGKTETEKDDPKIVAVEKDPALAEKTRMRFKNDPRVEVVEMDVIEFLWGGRGTEISRGKYKIAGNIPYYLTGFLLRTIGEMDRKPEVAVFMVQKEVAERAVAAPPHMNRLAAALGFWAEPKIVLAVGRKEFSPPPEVDSAVIELRALKQGPRSDAAGFYRTVRVLFAHPRKTVLNNLKEGLKAETARKEAERILEICGIGIEARPQDLSLNTIDRVALEVEKVEDGWG